jgi:hypothetical protein
MKRMKTEFYRDVQAVRDEYGQTEYTRKDIVPNVVALLKKHSAQEDAAWVDVANGILDHIETAEDKRKQSDLFSYGAHVALGGTRRIKRGRMNDEQLRRRKRVIDQNKRNQDDAWASESDWIWDRQSLLQGRPPETVVEDIMTEDGRPVVPEPEPV